ncbi:MAG: hypothetical protein ACHQ1D_04860 [Nitrososphaerales archaeon]
MSYMDHTEDYVPPERISGELRRIIRFLIKEIRRKNKRFDILSEEIINRFYPHLSKEEKLVCRFVVESSIGKGYCFPILDFIIYENKFRSKLKQRNILLILHSKQIVNWMTRLSYKKSKDGKILDTYRHEVFIINPQSIQDIAQTAHNEILKIRLEEEPLFRQFENRTYKQFLISKSSWTTFPVLN